MHEPRPQQIHPYNPEPVPPEVSVLGKKRGVATEEGSRAIGERLARLRKERGITQVEMAELLGLSQANVSDYERGELRLHGELLVKLARILKVSTDEILGLNESPPSRAPRDRRLLRRLQDVDKLSKRDREALLRTLDAFLLKAQPG
jgi:transcriptional regulator with XRE-family HTH domain